MEAKLKVVGGPYSGQLVQVPRGKLLIGRAEDCDVRPNSEFVSSHHCVLLLDDYTLRIRDLGSKNGTTVNGRRIGTGMLILLHDDLVGIGDMSMIVDLSQVAAATDSAGPETQPPISPAALQNTGVFEGDTVQAEIPPEIPPSFSPPPESAPVIPNPVLPNVVPPSPEDRS